MANDSGGNPIVNFFKKLWALIFPPQAVPAVMERKVLVIDFRPPAVVQAAAARGWMSTADLVAGYLARIKAASGNMLVYQVGGTRQVASYPVLDDGRCYDDATWAAALADDSKALRKPGSQDYAIADYGRIIQDFDLLAEVEDRGVDEVWLFGGPYFGFHESCMAGRGAFWCNGPEIPASTRRFVIMGFNYERQVKEMIHDYGHRVESILARKFRSQNFLAAVYPAGLADDAPLPPASVLPKARNGFEQYLLDHGTVHRVPDGVNYSQDEFAWLSGIQHEWWPLTIDPNRI